VDQVEQAPAPSGTTTLWPPASQRRPRRRWGPGLPERRRPPRWAGRVPGIIWLVVLVHLGVMLCQTALLPNFRAPDEHEQMDLVAQVAVHTWPWSVHGPVLLRQGSDAGGHVASRTGQRPHLAEHPLPDRADRHSYDQAGGTAPVPPNHRPLVNQLVQHPPLYYVLGAAVLAAIPGWRTAPFDRMMLALRWFDALLLTALPILLWATARRLRFPDPLPTAAALAPLAIPELTHMESAVNNDDLLILLGAVLGLLLARVLTGDARRRTAAWIGVVTSLALLTKGFAMVFPLWVVLAYLLAARRHGARPAAWNMLIAGAATLPGWAWWISNKLRYGTLQPHGENGPVDLPPAHHSLSADGPAWAQRLVDHLNMSFFVQDQEYEHLHNTSWTLAVVAGCLILLGSVTALLLGGLPRATTAVLLVPAVGMFAIVAKMSWEAYSTQDLGVSAMQGRYLYGALPGLVLAALAALWRLPAGVRRFVPLAVLAFAVAIQGAYAWYTLVLLWAPAGTTGPTALARSVPAILDWYPLPPAVLVTVAGATVAGALALVIALCRSAWRPSPAR
jgi:Predicted membrane protein (DUF2142)